MTDWKDVMQADVCIIGAGSGGLTVAAVTAQLGLKTVLIEKGDMGGDCLNTGCVPSKAFLAAAKRAQSFRKEDIKGIRPQEPVIDFSAVKDHVRDTIKAIEPHDSQERFEKLGVSVLRDHARFIDKKTIQAGNKFIEAHYFVVATGSSPVVPPVPGLNKNNERVFTNESIFGLRDKPDHLLTLGGGPIGIEMAQAHARLGCKVSVLDMGPILPRDDKICVAVVRDALQAENINLYENIKIREVRHAANSLTLIAEKEGKEIVLDGSHLLVAAGRRPNTDGLDLEKAGIEFDKKGIKVNARMRTSNKKVYAAGDVTGGPQFTHISGYQAGIIIRNICFKLPARVDYTALPWVTYTDPELAQTGLTEDAARLLYGANIRVTEYYFKENDRAVTERTTNGLIRIVTKKSGQIIGASIVGPHAGELLGEWALAISKGMKISAIASTVHPYPTLGEVSQRAAGAWYKPALFSKRTQLLVSFLKRLPF